MVKQFSSLGAWMDYFHSSTGVTETTCYVPFKFGGLPGVAIADYRAMSQPAFWAGQPQHDNIAGHSFLSYKTDGGWQYMVYRGTTYRSTGPNWMDIGLEYLSTDGSFRTVVDTFELPQADELRNFIRVRCDVLQPVTVENAKEDFRLLTIASWVQRLRYTHFAATGTEDQPLTFPEGKASLFSVNGHVLPETNAFMALYGESKGSNAFVLRNWSATVDRQPVAPAASVSCDKKGDTRLLLVANADRLELKPGDHIEFDGFWFGYGATDASEPARRETRVYGSNGPRIAAAAQGVVLADFPPALRAADNQAEFTLQGGRDVVPVIVTGLTDFRWPRIERKDELGWRPIPHGRVTELDGIQVFVEGEGRFGAVFLVHSDNTPQVLRVTVGEEPASAPRISVNPKPAAEGDLHHAALIQASWMKAPILLRFPETLHTDALDFIDHRRDDMPPRVDPQSLAGVWEESEADSVWFEWVYDNQIAGGRLTPNEDDVDLEFWLSNKRKEPVDVGLQFCPMLGGTLFEDRTLERTWIYTDGMWKRMAETDRDRDEKDADEALCHYSVVGSPPVNVPAPWGTGREAAELSVVAVMSKDGQYVFAIAWPHARSILSNAHIPCVHADPLLPACPPGRRVHIRGKVYLMKGTLNDLANRVRREVLDNRIGRKP
jgi:hypothetical protein